MVFKPGSFVAAAVLCLAWAATAEAADIKARALIRCIVDEARALTDLDAPADSGKAGGGDSWFANWLFSEPGEAEASAIYLHWRPSSPDGPSLKIADTARGRNALTLLSWTEDSVIGVISTSDRLTAQSWLYSVNFAQESVIATQVQSNIAGARVRVVKYSCDFEDRSLHIEAPASSDGLG